MSSDTVKIKATVDDYIGGWKIGDEFIATRDGSMYSFIDNDGHDRVCHMGAFNIVKDYGPSPIRTVTRKEVVPGKYGSVVVGGNGSVLLPQTCYTADELREAAHILKQIAEALEDV